MKFITQRLAGRAKAALVALAMAVLVMPSFEVAYAATPASALQACSQQGLVFGSSGNCVKELQRALVDSGFSVGPHGVDGQFGPYTRQGVVDYQQAHGLLVDGVPGVQTLTHLATGKVVAPGWSSAAPVAAPPPDRVPPAPTQYGKSMVAVEDSKAYYAYEDGQLVRSFAARFGGAYWDPVLEEVGHGSTPKGLYHIGYMQDDMVSTMFDVEMPHSMCFAGGALYCVHGSDAFDQFGYTHPFVQGEAGSAGCINLHTWDAGWLFDWTDPGTPLLVLASW